MSAKVAFDYSAEQPDELTLNVGETVTNIDQQDGGWWEGELNGKRGMFPENFVEVIAEEPSSSGQSGQKTARVTFQYIPEQPDELALEVGDILEVLEDDDEGWWKGKLGDKVGMFPSNFVECITGEPKSPALPDPIAPSMFHFYKIDCFYH